MEAKAGVFPASIADYGVSPGKDGMPRVWVKFEIKEGDESFHVSWNGDLNPNKVPGLKETPQFYTMASLKKMGFNGQVLDTYKLDDGMSSNELNPLLDLSVTCVKNGDYINVKYINLPGEGGVGKKYESKQALMEAMSKLSASSTSYGL